MAHFHKKLRIEWVKYNSQLGSAKCGAHTSYSSVFMADFAKHSDLSFLLNLDISSLLSITLQEATTSGLKMIFSVRLICSPCSQMSIGISVNLGCCSKKKKKNTIDWGGLNSKPLLLTVLEFEKSKSKVPGGPVSGEHSLLVSSHGRGYCLASIIHYQRQNFKHFCPLYLGIRVTKEKTNQASTGDNSASLM